MPRNYVLDTNVLLHDPQAIFHFGDSNLLIPIEVIEEIDSFKHDPSEVGRNSRTIAQILDGLRGRGQLGDGVTLDGKGTLKVLCQGTTSELAKIGLDGQNRVANSILSSALFLQAHRADEQTVVVTKNVNLRIKADALGIVAEDYTIDRFPEADQFPGWFEAELASALIAQLQQGKSVRVDGLQALPNEYVLAHAADDADNVAFGRVQGREGEIVPLRDLDADMAGVKPLNLEQTFARDALLSDDIKLVTLTGKAGTGKTLIAVAAGLRKVFAEDCYHRLLVFRPTMPVSRDIGYLPGDVQEKMRPWMQPIYDALELIREQDRCSPSRTLPPDIMECEEICIEPLTYIRGRSIPRQYIVIDEAQNLTPLETKTVITRVGKGTKIVLTGDPHQIDNPYVDALSNGLAFLVDRFRGSELSAHICLTKGERSALAETAANIL